MRKMIMFGLKYLIMVLVYQLKKHIFDRFFTGEEGAKDSRKGVGLGLSICKSIIQAHKGEIMVENNKDKGSTFKFSLPKENE